jgi:Ca-activated chloride channel family protein
MPAKIHVERMMYRSSIAVKGDSAASYALLKLIPAGGGGRVGLNLAMVIDVSGSMYEEDGTGISRLKRVQDAMKEAIAQLQPNDTVSIVAFAHNAQTVLEATKVEDKAKIEQTIDSIDMFDVDPGGTSMNEGIQAGMSAVEKTMAAGKLTQIVVLTDGETSGEQACRQLAKVAGEKKMHLTLMGVGTEWNSGLIKDLAKISEGKWYYIDVNEKASAAKVFEEEFSALASAGFLDVELHLRPVKDVIIKRVRMVVPEIKEIKTTEPEGAEARHMVAALGTLEHDQPRKYVLDLKLPKRPDGKYVIAQMEVTFNPGSGKRESTGMIPLEMQYTEAQHGYINAEVARYIDEVQLFEMNADLQKAIASDDKDKVQQVAEQIEKKGNLMGARAAKKTMLAKQVLQELNVGGRVSKKTQLAMDDMMRDVTEGQ